LQLRYHYVEFLTAHLADCCRVFGGDLQEMLVLAVMGQVHLRAGLDVGPDGLVKPRSIPGPIGITASRIADVTGIPRQTVRRKLAKLESRGWIVPKPSGLWVIALRDGVAVARQGKDGLDALDARSMDRVLRMARQLSKIVTGTERPL
jgi:predicted transcriptional regulator